MERITFSDINGALVEIYLFSNCSLHNSDANAVCDEARICNVGPQHPPAGIAGS